MHEYNVLNVPDELVKPHFPDVHRSFAGPSFRVRCIPGKATFSDEEREIFAYYGIRVIEYRPM